MKELEECLAMLDNIIATSRYAAFTGKTPTPEDYQKLKAWVESVEARLKALEEDYERRQADS